MNAGRPRGTTNTSGIEERLDRLIDLAEMQNRLLALMLKHQLGDKLGGTELEFINKLLD